MENKPILWVFGIVAVACLIFGLVANSNSGELKETITAQDTTIQTLKDSMGESTKELTVLTEQVKQVIKDKEVLQTTINDQKTLIEQKNVEITTLQETPVTVIKTPTEAFEEIGVYDVIDNLNLGDSITSFTLDNNDLSFLIDGEIEFDDEDYDVQEKIYFNSLAVATSLTGDEEFGAIPALIFEGSENIEYMFEFDDDINYSLINEDENLVLNSKILGEMNIIEMTSNSITVLDGIKYLMYENEPQVIDGKTVTILGIFEDDKVYVEVDGIAKSLEEGDSNDINGLNVRATEVMYTGKETTRSLVTLTIGADVETEYENGDEFIEDNEVYEWVIETKGNDFIDRIGVRHVEKLNDADEDVLRPTETMSFAGLFDIMFDYEESYDYVNFEIGFDKITSDDIHVLEIKSKDGKNLILGDEELETAYLDINGSIRYKNNNNDWIIETHHNLVIENDDLSYDVTYNSTKKVISISSMNFDVSNGFEYFGTNKEEAEADDLIIEGFVNGFGTNDEDLLLLDGTIIETPEDSLDDDTLKFSMPDETVKMLLRIGKPN